MKNIQFVFLAAFFLLFENAYSQSLYVSGIDNPVAAEGIYVPDGTYGALGRTKYKHETQTYYLYNDAYGITDDDYWVIDDNFSDEEPPQGDDVFFYILSEAVVPPTSGYSNANGTSASGISVVNATATVTFTNGAAYSPGSATANTTNNPLGRFLLAGTLSSASLTNATITIGGTRSGVSNLKIWASSNDVFNAGDDTQLEIETSTSETSVTFTAMNSGISNTGTYYFITADLSSTASGTITLSIASQVNLTLSAGTHADSFSNAPLSSGAVSIASIGPEIRVVGNSEEIYDGDVTPNLSDHTHFGDVDIDAEVVVRTYTINNDLSSNLLLTNAPNYVSLSPTDVFTVSSQPSSSSIASGSSTSFQITYNPSSIGLSSAEVSIANNDADENPFNFTIEGNGISADELYLDARDFASQGIFNPITDVIINMTSGAMSGGAIATGTLQNGIWVFAFDNFTLGATNSISFTGITDLGNRIALLSKSNMTISGQINAGASTYNPGPGGGQGGHTLRPMDGSGQGGGSTNFDGDDDDGAGGGGFGGAGGSSGLGAPGGSVYGDLTLALDGGSGGARSEYSSDGNYGGGGGGALQLGALGTLTINSGAEIKLDGADGSTSTTVSSDGDGGGSGGALLLHARGVNYMSGATIFANGGDGGTTAGDGPGVGGGGGGGGHVRIVNHPTGSGSTVNSGTTNVSGGVGGADSDQGISGSTGVSLFAADSNVPIGGSEIDLTGNSVSIADGDVSPSTTDDTDFGKTDLASGTITKTFTINNYGGDVLSISSIVLSSTAHFSINSAVPTSVAAGGSEAIDVVFDPSTTGVLSATLTINNNDDDEAIYDFLIQGEGVDIEAPSTQTHSILFSETHAAKLSLSWTRGGGDACAVFIAEGTGATAIPQDDASYAANSMFGSGDQIGTTGWYCIYNGPGTSANVNKINPGTTYNVMVCEYNEVSGLIRYFTDSATDNPSSLLTRDVFINEVDVDTPGTDSQEFVELYDGGAGNTSLDYLSVVFFNGSTDTSYDTFDLDGYSTDADGYFIIGGGSLLGADITFPDNTLQNGADAVALFLSDNADFPNGTAATTLNLIDAIVYDTNDADDAGLLVLINAGEPQVNEGGRGDSESHSLQRIANGSGGYRNTSTYVCEVPTPKAANTLLSIITVEGISTTIISDGDSSPDATDNTVFSDAIVNGETSTQTYTIKNSGLAALDITSVGIMGTNAADFSVTSSPASIVLPSGSAEFAVTFNPSNIGVRTAEISISNNDSDKNPYNFSIQGSGTNNAPTASNFGTSSGPYQNLVYSFATSDFGYTDIDSDLLDHIRLTTIPANGILYVDADGEDDYDTGEELSINDQVLKADIDAGNLQYYSTGSSATSFTFDVNDGIENSATTYTATLNVVAEPTVSLSLGSSSISETGGTTTAIATLSHAFGAIVTVDLSFSGTATLSNDYTRSGTSIAIPLGDTSGTVALLAESDLINESDETIIIDISTVANGAEDGDQQVTLTVSDDDVSELSIVATTQAMEDDTDGLFTISSDKQFDTPVNVTFEVNGTATEGTDFNSIGTTIVFPANSSSVTIPVEVVSDDLVESDEAVVISLLSTDNVKVAIGTSNEATVTITDDDTAELTIVATNQAIEDSANGLFTISTDKQFDAPVTVTFGVTGTATEGTDYIALGTTIVFPANSGSVSVSIDVIADSQLESDESVSVSLASTSNTDVTIGTSNEATVVIANDDILPVITTLEVPNQTETSASLGGNISDEGSASVAERGVVYSSADNSPTLGEPAVVTDANGSGGGLFSETISSLVSGVTYYYQAYAINAVGTSYGGVESFTIYKLPAVKTLGVSGIGTNVATGKGEITELGVPNPTAYGFCWSRSIAPTLDDRSTDEGAISTTGTFSSSITSLTSGATYHLRAYATNEAGTVYGSEILFTTKKRSQAIDFPTIADKTFGDADFSPSALASSGLGVSYTSSDENVATIIDGMVHIENAGSCVIYADQPGNLSYNSAPQVSQMLTVSKASQYITFNEFPEVKKGDDPLVLNATSSSGLEVCCACSNTESAYVEDGCLVIVEADTVWVTATQEGNHNYLAAAEVEQMLIINFATGVEELTLSEPLFYPNPVTRILYLNEACLGATSVNLYNLSGGLVLSEPNPTLHIDCSAINRGVYLIVVDLGEGRKYTGKIIKE